MKERKEMNKYQRVIHSIAKNDVDRFFHSYRTLRKIIKEVVRENKMNLGELVKWKNHRKEMYKK